MPKLIAANWKANPASAKEAVRLARAIEQGIRKSKNEIVIAPPFPFLLAVSKVIRKAKLGAQDMFWQDVGPYTGEVSWRQLKQAGVSYVIVGHSERRRWLGESDAMINKKIKAATKAGLVPILCIGEWTRKGKSWGAITRFVRNQLQGDLSGLSKIKDQGSRIVIAYEPVWAISTVGGEPDRPEDAIKMALFIRSWLRRRFGSRGDEIRILYGGSVNAKNAKNFMKRREIQGALVGGASLRPKEFLKICNAI